MPTCGDASCTDCSDQCCPGSCNCCSTAGTRSLVGELPEKRNLPKSDNDENIQRKREDLPSGRKPERPQLPKERIFTPKAYGRKNLRWRCPSKERVTESLPVCQPTLYGPLGLEFSLFNIEYFLVEHSSARDRKTIKEFQGYATCLVAFGELYTTPEAEWNSHVMNHVLNEGKNLYMSSINQNKVPITSKKHILKHFVVCQNAMEVQISEPIVIGMVQCQNSRIYSIGVGLAMFTKKYQHCVCEVQGQYFLIWRQGDAYFMFDCYGRTRKCLRNTELGRAALICVGSIKNISVILTNMSKLEPNAAYSLYEIRMKILLPCCEEALETIGGVRKPNYSVLNDEHAILVGLAHIGNECFKDTRFKQSLAIALIGVLYSKIDAPCTWDSAIVDKILIMGHKYYKMWTDYDIDKGLTLKEIPTNVRLGQFILSIAARLQAFSGTWCQMSSKTKEISDAIRNLFVQNSVKNIIVQVDRRSYGIWKRNNYYYILDPYPRTILDATYKGANKNATVHIFNSVDALSCILVKDIIQAPIPSPINIHVIKILGIKVDNKNLSITERCRTCVRADGSADARETQSLNESIYDFQCETSLKCSADFYDVGEDDLDAPPISESQNVPRFGEGDEGRSKISRPEEEDDEEEFEVDVEEAEGNGSLSETGSDSYGGNEKNNKKGKKDKKDKKDKKKEEEKYKHGSRSSVEIDSNHRSEEGTSSSGSGSDSEDGCGGKNKTDKNKTDKNKADKNKTDKNKADKDKTKKNNKKVKKDKKEQKEKNKHGSRSSVEIDSNHRSEEDTSLSGSGSDGRKNKKKKTDKTKTDKNKTDKNETDKNKTDKNSTDRGKTEKNNTEKNKTGEGKIKKNKRDKKNKNKKNKKSQHSSDSSSDSRSRSETDVPGKGTAIRGGGKKNEKKKGIHTDESSTDVSSKKSGTQRSGSSSTTGDSKEGGKKPKKEKVYESSTDSKSDSSIGTNSTRTKKSSRTSSSDGKSRSKSKLPPGCLPNSYPGQTQISQNMAVVGSESGSYKSLCNLISSGFKVADRMLAMTPWGNYAIFKLKSIYFLYDGCTCNPERFRNLDLSVGTAGLLYYEKLHDLIMQILKGKNQTPNIQANYFTADDVCREYCQG